MNTSQLFLKIIQSTIFCSFLAIACIANATTVQFQTSLGEIEVNLYDQDTPDTVANFLAYVDAGAYTDSIVHRSMPSFIVQGGGFIVVDNKVGRVVTSPSPSNEPKYSSVKGTIAMAKLGGDPDSATSQWFFNLGDNASNLDVQNGGFTVFGEVIAGWEVVEAIAALKVENFGAPLDNVPLRGYQGDIDLFNEAPADYLMLIDGIVVLDAAQDTAAELSPVLNTLLGNVSVPTPAPTPTPTQPKKKKKKFLGSADFGLLVLLLLAVGSWRSCKRR